MHLRLHSLPNYRYELLFVRVSIGSQDLIQVQPFSYNQKCSQILFLDNCPAQYKNFDIDKQIQGTPQ